MQYSRSGAVGHAGDSAGTCLHLDGRVQGGRQLRWWFGILFGVLVDFGEIDGWVSWGVLFGVLFRVMVRAHFCSIDGRVLLGALFGGSAFGGAGLQALLSGVYAGVICFCFHVLFILMPMV